MKSTNKDVKFVFDDIKRFIHGIEKQQIKKLWLVGGSELIDAFYTQGRIDEFILTVFPAVLNRGIDRHMRNCR